MRTVTDRFSKIGSDPELSAADLADFMSETMAYLERRMPKGVVFSVALPKEGIQAAFNPALFGWVLENLTNNAVDAMEGKGRLDVELTSRRRTGCARCEGQWSGNVAPGAAPGF